MTLAVAYWISHSSGIEQGLITGPGFESDRELVDLYEADVEIKSFASDKEAQAWLDAKTAEHEEDMKDEEDFADEVEEVLGS